MTNDTKARRPELTELKREQTAGRIDRADVRDREVPVASGSETDHRLELEVTDEIRCHAEVRPGDIAVTVHDGWVTMEGCVDWDCQRASIGHAIRFLPGVRGVTNLLRVTSD